MEVEQPGSKIYTLPAFFFRESEEKNLHGGSDKSTEFTNKQK